VYEAKLRTGEDVVIKVQKPNAATVLKTDLSFMYVLSRLIELVNPEFANRLSLSDIVGDIRK
jgi:aarF domain-containing kinase